MEFSQRRDVDSYSGVRGNILTGPLWGENCLIVFKWRIMGTLY